MPLRSVIESAEAALAAAGYSRAAENFTLERVPASVAHRSYTLGRLDLRPRYVGGNTADYLGARLPLLIAFRVHGDHNPSGSFAEAYLQAADAFEALEDALVAAQPGSSGENNSIESALLQPLLGSGAQEYLLLSINLSIDLLRPMA